MINDVTHYGELCVKSSVKKGVKIVSKMGIREHRKCNIEIVTSKKWLKSGELEKRRKHRI